MEKNIIDKVAGSAKIKLEDSEKKKLEKDMKSILESFSGIDKVNTGQVEPAFQPIEAKNIAREDIPEKCLSQKEALANTKLKEKGYFKGPKAK